MKKVILGLGLIVALGFVVSAGLSQHKKMFHSQKKLELRLVELEGQVKGLNVSLKKIEKEFDSLQGKEDYAKVYDIDIGDSVVSGPKDAPITIVEFVDFQCPYCARFHPLVLEALKAYSGKVRAVIKNYPLPFHKEALPAAKAAFAAGEQGKYWEMANAILSDNSNLNDKLYRGLAKKIGLNTQKFSSDLKEKDGLWQEYVQKDIALGNRIDVRGTPTIYINGRKTQARNIAGFKEEIESVLRKK